MYARTGQAPSFYPLGSRTGLLGSPPQMWTWTQWPSQPGAVRNTQASRWHLLEPRLRLGLSHLPLGKASRARGVLKMAGGQLAGRRAAPGDRRGGRGEGGARCPKGGEGSCWPAVPTVPTPTVPPVYPVWLGGGGPGSHASTDSSSSRFLAHLHPHHSPPTPREGMAPQLYR